MKSHCISLFFVSDVENVGAESLCYGIYMHTDIMSLVFVHSCVDIWSTNIDYQICCLGISLVFHVSVKH